MRVVVDMGGIADIEASIAGFLEDELGPMIVSDARRYAPKRTGELAAGISHFVDGPNTLYIISAAPYTLWVEYGHRVFHPSTGVAGPDEVLEEPFIRPAVYKYRTPAVPFPPAMMYVGIARPGGPTLPNLYTYETQRLHWKFDLSG